MKKRGFTLIELLAVIIILAVIALIATPVVLNVVENAKKEANKNSVYGLLDGAKYYYAESLLNPDISSNVNGTTNLIDEIKISGDKPDSGAIYVNSKGEIAVAVVYDDVCYTKNFSQVDLQESDDITNCTLGVDETPVVENSKIEEISQSPENGEYAKEKTIRITFNSGNIESPIYQYSLDGSNWTTVTEKVYDIKITSNGKLYARTIDANGNEIDALTYTVTNIDASEPVVNISSVTTTAVTATVTGSCEDLESGITKIEYSKDGINFQESNEFNELTSGNNYTFQIRCTNGSGITSTANKEAATLTVSLSLASTSGSIVPNESTTVTINASNNGTLTCVSANNNIATCSINNKTLTVNGISEGNTTITVSESYANKTATYSVTVESSLKCKRATTLHTEVCTQTSSSSYYCGAAGYSNGSTITYGSKGTKGTLKSGDAFDCDVNGDGIYNSTTERFYYVSDLYNTSTKTFDSNYAVLVYYNNTKSGVANNTTSNLIEYNTTAHRNYYGPVTAVTYLPTTTQWNNVSLSNTKRIILTETGTPSKYADTDTPTFNYSGYAARLLTYQEIGKACGITVGYPHTGELDRCNYLMENTKFSNSTIGTDGYWLETNLSTDSAYVWYMDAGSRQIYKYYYYFYKYYGVRPAIEVLKTDIEI